MSKIKDTTLPFESHFPLNRIPKLKGKTRIELFEGEEKIFEQSDENMVTNYLDKLLNPQHPIIRMANTTTSGNPTQNYDPLFSLSTFPLYQQMFGGVMLFSEPKAEEPDKFLLGNNYLTDWVGRAGSPYSGADSKTGTYNTNESGPIEGGYRHVWDFGTDKSNGPIACVGLASRQMVDKFPSQQGSNGSFGFVYTGAFNAENNSYMNRVELASARIGSADASSGHSGLMYNVTGNLMGLHAVVESGKLWVYYLARYTGAIYKINIPNPSAYSLMDRINPDLRNEADTKIITVYTPTTPRNSMGSYYNGKIYINNTNVANLMTVDVINLDGTLDTSFDITPYKNFNTSYTHRMYIPQVDKVIAKMVTTNTLEILNRDGTQLSNTGLTGSNDYPTGIIYAYGYLIATTDVYSVSSSKSWVRYILLDPETGEYITWNGGSVLPPDTGNVCGNSLLLEGMDTPYLLVSAATANTYTSTNEFKLSIDLLRINHALATINNLASPVVKTPAQTMKVTYEITNE